MIRLATSIWSTVWLMAAPVQAGAAPSRLASCVAASAPAGLLTTASVPGALARGVNLTDALAGTVDLRRVEQDMRMIRGVGLRHVRLPIRPGQLMTWPGDGSSEATPRLGALDRLDAVICAALRHDLTVILDMHPEQGLALQDSSDASVVARLAAAWDQLASRYAAVSPRLMVFEALNEPRLTDPRRWERELRTLLGHIRAAAPLHTVLLSGSPFGSAAALSALTPVSDPHVAYVFHVYTPLVFTHQGADWTTPSQRSIRGLAYPATELNVAQVRAGADPQFQAELARYLASDGGDVRSEIDQAAGWAARNGAQLVVTEFGVFGAADARSRTAWLHDVADALEADGIGWSVWEYRGGFGIDTRLAEPCRAPGSMRAALHLCPASDGLR